MLKGCDTFLNKSIFFELVLIDILVFRFSACTAKTFHLVLLILLASNLLLNDCGVEFLSDVLIRGEGMYRMYSFQFTKLGEFSFKK